MAGFAAAAMPHDWREGHFVGRVDRGDGPSVVLLRGGRLIDVTASAPTVSAFVAMGAPPDLDGADLGDLDGFDFASADAPVRLLSPIDLQCVKASGVTFAVSALERVIEEAARGDADAAQAVRARLETRIGGGLRSVKPGSAEAGALKAALIEDGLWSQYLEVAIGPDAEIFTKCPVLSTVGWGAAVGVRSDSHWNNPEPEVVLLVGADGRAVGATLGNDVNLRDFEGRSALLLGKAKDNNASASLGPFVRLFDDGFAMDDVRQARLDLTIAGADDGYVLRGASSMDQISRDPEELVRQALSEHHYPDGFVLYLGTLFAPTDDRDAPGRGFTHKVGDTVTIASPRLGTLTNPVLTSRDAPAWDIGIGALMASLAGRGVIGHGRPA